MTQTTTRETFARWDAVEELLHHPEEFNEYLQGCIEEDPGDGSLIRAALSDIARAQNVAQLAKTAGLSRHGLYKALSADGNPSFATLLKIAGALGLRLRLEPVENAAEVSR